MISILPCRYDADDHDHLAGGLNRNEARCDLDPAQNRRTIDKAV